MSNLNVAAYIRLSKEDEKEGESESIINQKELIKKYIEENKLGKCKYFVDDGYSGGNFERPQFKELIKEIEKGNISTVITKDTSRLGRDFIETSHYMFKYFPEHNIRYIAILENFDTSNPNGVEDMIPFQTIINDWYLKDISKKIKSVKRDKQRKGQFIGGKPVYGYKMHPTEKNKIIIDEEVAPIVRRIFAMALDGVSCRQIAATLNEEGVPTPATYCGWNMGRKGPYAGLWSSERISDMLQNETYIGNMVQGRQVKISYKSKKCLHQDRNNWVVVEDTHEPLIDAESFRKVRMLVNSRKRTRSRTYDFLLKGLIFCHECGYPLGVLNRPNAKGEETLYFVCRTYQRFTKNSACTTHYIKEKTVTDAVIAKVREVCEDYLTAEALLPAAEKAVKEASQESKTAAEISALQNKSANLTEHLDRMYTDRLSGLLPEEDFQRIFTRIKDERAQLEERIKELQQQQKNPISQTERAKDLVQRYLDTACANRELLVSLIERIELTAAREIIVKFRFAELQQTG